MRRPAPLILVVRVRAAGQRLALLVQQVRVWTSYVSEKERADGMQNPHTREGAGREEYER